MIVKMEQIGSAIKNAGIAKKYNLTEEDVMTFSNYLFSNFSSNSNYQIVVNGFIREINKWYTKLQLTSLTNEEFENRICTEYKRGNSMYEFSIYCRNDIVKSSSCKFLEEFTDSKIDEVLKIFGHLNMSRVHSLYKKYAIYQTLKQIFNYHLMTHLAKYFYTMTLNLKHGVTNIYSSAYYTEACTCATRAIIQNKTLDYIVSTDSVLKTYESITTPDMKNKILQLTEELYEINKTTYDFLNEEKININKMREMVPDLDIAINMFYYGKKNKALIATHGNTADYLFVACVLKNYHAQELEPDKFVFKEPVNHKYDGILVVEV
jgi:hypothetical protein